MQSREDERLKLKHQRRCTAGARLRSPSGSPVGTVGAVRFDSLDALQRLIDHGIPEAPSLEYKRELHLDSRGERLEALKDLTAMANGGGGSIIFGMDEGPGEFPVAAGVRPLSDRSLPGRLEDILRDGVRPPLLAETGVIEHDDGFVLVADVQPSPLGPYMVQAYGNLQYHRRVGRRTEPMTEQQVRDAYALAARAREHRAALWEEHALPMIPPTVAEPWVSVAALPEEPLVDVIDVGAVEPMALRPSGGPLVAQIAAYGLEDGVYRLRRWADGLYGHDAESTPRYVNVRLHRDGAVGVARHLRTSLSGVFTARVANAELAYVAWVWERFKLVRPVEVTLRLDDFAACSFDPGGMSHEPREVRKPPDVALPSLAVTEYLMPWDLARARIRHRLVQRFVERLYHAFGLPTVRALFQWGQLYRTDTGPVGYSIAGAGVWHNPDGRQHARVYDDGSVRNGVTENLRAWWLDGALVDLNGDTIAVLEMAPGLGCPDDFLPSRVLDSPNAICPRGDPGTAFEAPTVLVPPTPTSKWSSQETAREFFQPMS